MISQDIIEETRKIFIEELKNLEEGKRVQINKLNIGSGSLYKLIFDYKNVGRDSQYKEFCEEIKPFLNKIDFTGIDFSLFRCHSFYGKLLSGVDFSGTKGITINPQTIIEKDLSHCKFSGVRFIGSFNDVRIDNSDFTGSVGARIAPFDIKGQCLSECKFSGVEFIGSFG